MNNDNYNVIMVGLSFEWDEHKSFLNKKKRGLRMISARRASGQEQRQYWQRWKK